jgi:hypothetical protein
MEKLGEGEGSTSSDGNLESVDRVRDRVESDTKSKEIQNYVHITLYCILNS